MYELMNPSALEGDGTLVGDKVVSHVASQLFSSGVGSSTVVYSHIQKSPASCLHKPG